MYNKIHLSIQKKISKISKPLFFYKGHDLKQALYRLYFTEKRKPYKIQKKFNIFNPLKNLILKLPTLMIFFKKEKTDFIIVSNTRYKIQKALDRMNIKSKKKNCNY